MIMSRNPADSMTIRAIDTLVRHPRRTIAALCAGVFLLSQIGDGNEVAMQTTPRGPASPLEVYDASPADWTSRFTIETSAGGEIDVACRGKSEVTVLEGQTLSELAAGIDTRQLGVDLPSLSLGGMIHVLVEANEISDQDLIFEGQTLALPKECAVMNVFVD
jgi:hypothetical protein